MKFTVDYLMQEGLMSEENALKLREQHASKKISLFWHVRTILYLGVTLLASGFGTLVYKNIDGIGHTALVFIIGLTSAACFYYCFQKALPYSHQQVKEPSTWLDYILLLGTLLFLTFEGYLQYQFNVFGSNYGLATILPAIILFIIAYRFDHLGILTLAITLFATWMGISLTPKDLLVSNDFSSQRIIFSGILLGILLTLVGFYLSKRNIKKHFAFTYYNFAFHLSAVAILGATFTFNYGLIWMLLLLPVVGLAYYYSKMNKSFYFLLCAFGYSYVAASYLIIRGMFWIEPDGIIWAYILMIYFIVSGLYAIKFLRKSYKSIADDARV